jgi:hypothetical protein
MMSPVSKVSGISLSLSLSLAALDYEGRKSCYVSLLI